MINPLYKHIKKNGLANSDRILRAIYSFEAFQMIKKTIKVADNNANFIRATLKGLLGIDPKKYGTHPPSLFEDLENPKFHDQYYIDENIQTDLSRLFWFADFCIYLPTLFQAVDSPDPVKYIQEAEFPSFEDALGISCDANQYKFYTIVESFLYPSKETRVDDEKNVMKFKDIGVLSNAEAMLKTYVQHEYELYYQAEVEKNNLKREREIISRLVDDLYATEDINEFIQLLRDGTKFKDVIYKIANTEHFGYPMLRDLLIDNSGYVPLHAEKIKYFMLACDDDGNTIWNNGNVLRDDITDYESVYSNLGLINEWNVLRTIHKTKSIHRYRESDLANRHGHCNSNPSYWALNQE